MRSSPHTNCCGMTVITVMGTGHSPDSNEALQALVGIVQSQGENPSTYSNRCFEIVLNDAQAKTSPKLLALMARLGFVLVTRSNNGVHNSWINVFHRTQRNGVAYVKPTFNWDGPTTLLPDHQVKPMTFKRATVPNPFARGSGVFDMASINEFIKAEIKA